MVMGVAMAALMVQHTSIATIMKMRWVGKAILKRFKDPRLFNNEILMLRYHYCLTTRLIQYSSLAAIVIIVQKVYFTFFFRSTRCRNKILMSFTGDTVGVKENNIFLQFFLLRQTHNIFFTKRKKYYNLKNINFFFIISCASKEALSSLCKYVVINLIIAANVQITLIPTNQYFNNPYTWPNKNVIKFPVVKNLSYLFELAAKDTLQF